MPNICWNKLSVIGPESSVASFVGKAYAPMQRYLLSETERMFGRIIDVPNPPVPLSFHALVPIPNEVLARTYGDDSPGSGYHMERKLWGVKWGACNSRLLERKEGIATYTFETAWCPADVFLMTVSEQFPELTFALSWGEQYPWRGRRIYRAGVETEVASEQDFKCDINPDDDEEGYCAANDAWRDAYLRTHEGWIKTLGA